ncbi:unnamed protein product [Larinioides sclopetarius]|uniref:Ribosomal protein S14 n=1 Tax=Larinioides sclopetarius TaxID=280406 RepID=A0AAV2BS10_9ARAC
MLRSCFLPCTLKIQSHWLKMGKRQMQRQLRKSNRRLAMEYNSLEK